VWARAIFIGLLLGASALNAPAQSSEIARLEKLLVVRFWLDQSLGAVKRSEILETSNPLFDGVTTGAMDGNSFLFFANTQSRKIQPDGSAKPGVELHPIVILRLKL
jgi:hypothetical protein